MKRFLLFILTIFSISSSENIITGAGATFPYPLYKKWIEIYQKFSDNKLTYKAIGSSKGIQSLVEKEVDFGATDAFIKDSEMLKIGKKILHIPTCIGAVVIIYNLYTSNKTLNLTPNVLSDIFMGKIKNWSDKRIQKINPNIDLPDKIINIVHRSDGSGTTFIFTNYLSKTSKNWKSKIGSGERVRWPTGMGVDGNPAVAEMVKKIEGSIGYTELTFAHRYKLQTASIQNRSGNFISPTLKSVSLAANIKIPQHTRILLVDTEAKNGYPISGFSYIIIYKEQAYNNRSIKKVKALVNFLKWIIYEGQKYSLEAYYSPLPKPAVKIAESVIESVTYNNKPLK